MDKIFSARLDESVLTELEQVTHQHHMTKKKFLEEAIHRLAESMTQPEETDIWAQTSGVWKRKESPAALVKQIRSKVNQSFERRHRP